MANDDLIIGKKKGFKRTTTPTVTPEVERWGALVTWLRSKDYTPDMVRATILDYEKGDECTGSESTLKQQD